MARSKFSLLSGIKGEASFGILAGLGWLFDFWEGFQEGKKEDPKRKA